MKIEILEQIPEEQLIEMVRWVPLKKPDESGNTIYVYKDARIMMRDLHTQEVNPTSFYAIKGKLQFQRDLRQYMLENFGIDTLRLNGALRIYNHDSGETMTLTPPIIELTPRHVRFHPQDGEIDYSNEVEHILVPIINDGLHRALVAHEADGKFRGVVVVGADPRYPFYAHPNSWDKIRHYDRVPEDKRAMKRYRKQDNYAVYRDFGVFGVGAPRCKQ